MAEYGVKPLRLDDFFLVERITEKGEMQPVVFFLEFSKDINQFLSPLRGFTMPADLDQDIYVFMFAQTGDEIFLGDDEIVPVGN
jgi:hypothetical protein